MLTRERWWHARAGLTALKQNGVIEVADDLSKQYLLSEQYRTQIALEGLGVALTH